MPQPKQARGQTPKRSKDTKSIDGGPGRPRDNHRAARLLAEAALSGDATVCAKAGITVRTLQRYREALATDPELSRLYDMARQQVTQLHWAKEIDQTLGGAARKLLALIDGATSSDPETIQAVTGAIQSLAEIAMTRDMLAARLQPDQPDQPGAADAAAYAVN